MIDRILSNKLKSAAKKFPLVALIGPRQSGKTTLAKAVFPNKPYVSLEDLDTRIFAQSDPRGFLDTYKNGAILDEIQRVPELFSYLQSFVDEKKKNGQFILTGSQHFLLNEHISQTLSGRIFMLSLLPFSLAELKKTKHYFTHYEDYLFRGFYPRIYDQKISPPDWYQAYIQTYIERDVRLIKNISDLGAFQKFIRLAAGRIGQLLNLSSLANDCGITHNTAKSWLSLLESSFLIFLLQPYHTNFNKRLVKMPKLYFYDVGLASHLLGIENKKQLDTHYLRGNLFENLIISELVKNRLHEGKSQNGFFWRDKSGHEIDYLTETGGLFRLIEIKSGKTVAEDFFKNIYYFQKISKKITSKAFLVYAGKMEQKRSGLRVINWQQLESI